MWHIGFVFDSETPTSAFAALLSQARPGFSLPQGFYGESAVFARDLDASGATLDLRRPRERTPRARATGSPSNSA